MTEMIGFNPEADRANKVQAIKNKLVDANFLKPNQEQKDKLAEKIKGVFVDELKHGADSVTKINETIQGPSNTYSEVQKENARKDKEILSEATILAVREMREKKVISDGDLFLGSKHMENMLPNELKGLGREITKSFISNEEIDKQLNLLEITRQNLDTNNPNSIETFVQKIELRIEKLATEDYEDEISVGEQDAVLTVLNGEKRKYLKTRSGNVGRSQGKDAYISTPFVTDPETGDVSGGMARYDAPPEKVAEAFLFMDSDLHWDSYRNFQWFKDLGKTKEGERQQARIEYMVMVNNGASWVSRFGPNLEKIRENPMYFAFDNEKMTKLFDPDFKLVMSKMLNDLCEFDGDKDEKNKVDKNGQTALRYKEGINGKGKQGILEKVERKLENIRDYKEELADFLAKENGRKEANYMDKMNAYTAWNLFYMFGDSSVADRRRVLPTYGQIINDGLRTLNPEYKALGKWKISKGDVPESSLDGAEWFGGPLGVYVQTVMQLERDLGHDIKDAKGNITGHEDKAIDGDKTLREKMIDGEMSLLNTKTFYGFLDFTAGGRDLYDKDKKLFYEKDKEGKVKVGQNRQETLSSLLMNYASFDEDGKLISKNEDGDFSFGNNQVDFLNWYRDQMEASALVLNATTGKEDVKDIGKFVAKIRTAFGMVDGINVNGDRPYKYTKDPDLWANILLGSFGVDMNRLSTDFIYLKTTQPESYSINVGHFIVDGLELSNNDVKLSPLMRKLGIDIRDGEGIDSFKSAMRNEVKWRQLEKRTRDLKKKVYKK